MQSSVRGSWAGVELLSMPATEQPQTNGQSTITALQDAIYGTRNYTSGARYQLPRKVPLRIEPKTYFGEIAEPASRIRLMPVPLHLLRIAENCRNAEISSFSSYQLCVSLVLDK